MSKQEKSNLFINYNKKDKKIKMAREVIVACSGGRHLGRSIARKIQGRYCKLITERFPDSELKVRLGGDVKGKRVIFVQSFFKTKEGDINDKFVELLFAAYTAKELGARRVDLIAPYLAYLREDYRFKKGEAVSAKILVKLFKVFSKVYVVEPHLHRYRSFKELSFPNAVRIDLGGEFAKFIKARIGDCSLVGPDEESEQWVKPVAKKLKIDYQILSKKRFSSRSVKVRGKKTKSDRVVIIDDIISTGNTLIEASKLIRAKKIYFIAAHGLFAETALERLKKVGRVIVSNTIPSKMSRIDCVKAIVKKLK